MNACLMTSHSCVTHTCQYGWNSSLETKNRISQHSSVITSSSPLCSFCLIKVSWMIPLAPPSGHVSSTRSLHRAKLYVDIILHTQQTPTAQRISSPSWSSHSQNIFRSVRPLLFTQSNHSASQANRVVIAHRPTSHWAEEDQYWTVSHSEGGCNLGQCMPTAIISKLQDGGLIRHYLLRGAARTKDMQWNKKRAQKHQAEEKALSDYYGD